MKAIVYDDKLRLVENYPAPVPGPGELLIDVHLAGICQTDIEITRGYMGYRGVLGHEFVGTVRSVGEGGGEKGRDLIGRRVVGEINCVCHRCEMCRDELGSHCLDRSVLGIAGRDGCMAEQVVLPAENVHPVSDNVTDRQAVLVEPLAAAFQVVEQVPVNHLMQAVVIGDGRLGQFVAQVLTAEGLRPLVVGKHERKLQRLRQLCIDAVMLDDARPQRRAHLVVEASGSLDGLRLAMQFVRPRGTIVLKSTIAAEGGINLSPIVVDEVTVVGSRCGPFPRALAALEQGRIDTGGFISGEYPLEDFARAFAAAKSGEGLKVIFRIR